MVYAPSWNDIERTIQLHACMVAQASYYWFDMDSRGKSVAENFLGTAIDAGAFPAEISEAIASTARVKDTAYYRAAIKCHEFVTSSAPINELDSEDVSTDGLIWLDYFRLFLPGDEISSSAAETDLHANGNVLEILSDACAAKIELGNLVSDVFSGHAVKATFFPIWLAHLAEMTVTSLRNVISPSGNKPIRSFPGIRSDRRDLVTTDVVDSIEWLAGRRGFDVGGISRDWASDQIRTLLQHQDRRGIPQDRAAIALLPCLYGWVNKTITAKIADAAGMEPVVVSEWARGSILGVREAETIATAVGLDGQAYGKLVQYVLQYQNMLKNPTRSKARHNN